MKRYNLAIVIGNESAKIEVEAEVKNSYVKYYKCECDDFDFILKHGGFIRTILDNKIREIENVKA